MRRASRMGDLETMSRLRTRSLEAMERSGRITRFGMRWYSMAGMMATSAAPVRSSSAHCDGTVRETTHQWRGIEILHDGDAKSVQDQGSRGKTIIAELIIIRSGA